MITCKDHRKALLWHSLESGLLDGAFYIQYRCWPLSVRPWFFFHYYISMINGIICITHVRGPSYRALANWNKGPVTAGPLQQILGRQDSHNSAAGAAALLLKPPHSISQNLGETAILLVVAALSWVRYRKVLSSRLFYYSIFEVFINLQGLGSFQLANHLINEINQGPVLC